MKLQILIPRYNQSEEDMNILLTSIALQQNINFNEIGVIICDDGSHSNLPSNLFHSYPFKIQYITISHSGVSAARQSCLDKADADYVMWCDADDMFYTPIGILNIFNMIDNGGFNILESAFIEETRDVCGNIVYIENEKKNIFIHGKVFNRKWLIKNSIKWDKSITVLEDFYFTSLARECCGNKFPNYRYYETPFYLWRWSSQSASNSDPRFCTIDKVYYLIDSNAALIRELLKRGIQKESRYYCCSLIFDLYYYFNTNNFFDKTNQKCVEKISNRFKNYYKEFGWLFEETDALTKKEIKQDTYKSAIDDPIYKIDFIHFSFEDWLDQILHSTS